MRINDLPTFCEFFAGIGLVRAGLPGWRCVYANDFDPVKQRAYAARFGPDHFHLSDVWATQEVVQRIPGRPTLATASFPCIDLSTAGHYRGFDGRHSSAFFGFADVLGALGERRPPLVLLENVPGFLTSRGGQDFATAMHRLADLGYWLDVFLLDACHFVPQSRPRVFVVGTTTSLPTLSADGWLFPPESNPLRPLSVLQLRRETKLDTGWLTLPLPAPPALSSSLGDVIDTDDRQDWWDEAEVTRHREMMNGRHRQRLDEILRSRRAWVGTIFRRIRQGKQRAEVRFDGLAGCLRTPRGGSARQIVVAIESGRLRMRWMTPKEYARLQGTPDFPLIGTTTQQLWAFADAVCVPAVAWINQHVLTPLLSR
jgi:DNA (cytosine-5)-methyltransferase 1